MGGKWTDREFCVWEGGKGGCLPGEGRAADRTWAGKKDPPSLPEVSFKTSFKKRRVAANAQG